MPLPPAMLPFASALNMTMLRTQWSTDRALQALIDACCDSAFETWGHHPGQIPKLVANQRWIEFKYKGTALPFEIENIELITADFLKWLLPELLHSDAEQGSEDLPTVINATASEPQPTQVAAPVLGKQTKAERLKIQMRSVPRDQLRSMLGKEMETRFGASRTYCADIRKQVLSETPTSAVSSIDK